MRLGEYRLIKVFRPVHWSLIRLTIILLLMGLASCSNLKGDNHPLIIEVDNVEYTGWRSATAGIDYFLGVPFAAPPIGPLRWQLPKPWVADKPSYSSQEFAPACMQGSHIVDWYREVIVDFGGDPDSFVAPKMSEDCLYLNIWRPQTIPKKGVPVIVYIHGGSNVGGWSFEPNYSGRELAKRGVMVITIAYRLGVFGFFSHPDLEHTNFALYDQLSALQWIQNNISAFGGDANNVTIMGESVGADHVTYLLASPLSKGLFRRAIHQSGGASMTNGIIRPAHLKLGEAFARQLLGSDTPDAISKMRAYSPEKILEASDAAFQGHYFEPVVDQTMVTKTLVNALQDNQIHLIDLLIGSTDDEWLIYLPTHVDIDGWLAENVTRDQSNRLKHLLATIDDQRRQLDLLITAQSFVCPSLFLAEKISERGGKTWFYSFNRQRHGSQAKTMGAYHGAELPYVFNTHDDWLPTDEHDRQLTNSMQSYWVSFAKTGNPNSADDQTTIPAWPAFTSTEPRVQYLDKTIDNGPHSSRTLCAILSPLRYLSKSE